jgi:TetR/AcrR family transcriptional regulator, acrAB operon repressor
VTPPGRRRIDEIGDESRRRILDAAEELFAERGFDRTSFVDIAERSGISRGSIPWHFRNKDGLVLAVLERAVNRLVPAERYRTVPSLPELFDDASALARTGNSALILSMSAEAIRGTDAVRTQYQEFYARRRAGLEDWLRARRPAGVDPDEAAKREHTFAVALNGLLMGVHLQAVVDPANVDLNASLRSIAELIDKNLADLYA